MPESQKTCSECRFFLGCGDWDLCCALQKRRLLCYGDSTACEGFEPPLAEGNE